MASPWSRAARQAGQDGSPGRGRRRGGKTKLVFEAEGLKGGCVCPSQPPGRRACESLVA